MCSVSAVGLSIEACGGTAEFIKSADNFLISTHVNPDGDGVGSALAIKWALDRIGKRSTIIIDSEPPDSLAFLGNYDWVEQFSADHDYGAGYSDAILVDCPNTGRIGNVAKLLADDANIVIIDHHVSNDMCGSYNLVDQYAASSAEVVYRLIRALGLEIDKQCAEYIYTGIVVDTGRFRFSNTGPETFMVASELLSAGVEPDKVSEKIFYHNTLETTKALGDFIESIQLSSNDAVATAQFDYDYIQGDNWKLIDTEGFVNHALAIQGVEIAVFFKEIERGVTRASLRSKNELDVNNVAKVFSGGGHAKAAGCTIEKPLEEAKIALLTEINKLFE